MLTFDAATRLRTQLGELPELLTLAHLALVPSGTNRGDRVTGATRTPPLPASLHLLDLLGPRNDAEPGPDHVILWAEAVIADRRRANDWTGWARVPHALHGERSVSVAIRYLLLHHPFAITRAYAPTYAAEIAALHRTLNRATGMPIVTRPVRMVCPRCTLLAMRERLDGHRECHNPGCKAVLTRDEYAAHADAIAA